MNKTPHFKIPFEFKYDSFETLEQDTEQEIRQSVLVLLNTVQGERIEAPTYGISDLVFMSDQQAQRELVVTQLQHWEPRAFVNVNTSVNGVDELILDAVVNVSKKA